MKGMLVHFETLEADKTTVKNVNDKLVERLVCSDQKIVLRKHPLSTASSSQDCWYT